jgi:potassium efflux system protein
MVLSGTAAAADVGVAAEDARDTLAIDSIRERAKEVEASSGLDKGVRDTLGELYRKTITSLEAVSSYRQLAQDYEGGIQSAGEDAERVRAEIDRKRAEMDMVGPDIGRLPLNEIEQRLVADKARLASAESRLSEIKGTITREQDRVAVIPQRITDANDEISRLQAEPAAKVAEDALPEVTQARRWATEARLEELRAEVLMLGQELASQPMRLDLLQARRDLAALELNGLEWQVERLETLANEIRLEQTVEAKIEAQVAELSAAGKHPLVARLAARNTQLSKDVEKLAGEINDVEREQRQTAESARRIEEDFAATRKKVEVAGVSQILGQVLLEQRRSLPETARFRRLASLREQKIAETTLSQILLEEEREVLQDIPAYVAGLSSALPSEVRAQVADELERLTRSRLELVEQALTVYRRYLQTMGELDIAQHRLEAVVGEFQSFLAERLLWVRSSQVAGPETMRLIPGQLADLFAPGRWVDVLDTLSDARAAGWVLPALLIAGAIGIRRRRLSRALKDCGADVGKLLRDRLGLTLQALALVILIALPWPLVMWTTGWILSNSLQAADFTKDVGGTLMRIALLFLQLETLRLFVAPGSIAEAHFGWRQPGLARLRADLRWFSPLLVLLGAFTMLTFASTASDHWGSGLARAVFVLVMALLALFFFRFARPNGGTISVFFAHLQDGTVFRWRHLWFVLLVGSPLIAAGTALAGYTYTAGRLIDEILSTVWFAVLVVIVHQLVIRWLVLDQRKLRLQAARERRRAESEARGAEGRPEETAGVLSREVEEPEVDLHLLDAASRKLTNNVFLLIAILGIWAIWKDVLPALGVLDKVTLWSYTKPGVKELIPITLSSLGLALLIFVVMLIAIRQLPAFLEITLLQRLQMSQGSRYTVITLTKYTVVAIAVAWIFGTLGGSWSEIQWIFAALGVGIGFGLQEIVANFISGLIILFERPIRVGDVVTVGNTDGVVTRIRIRATTIRNWDQKELLVPNKNFITQELLNWSLSDQTTRILIRVGVAYGSDVNRALSIMEEAARGHTRVLAEPAPFVVFEEFGDNALLLSLRCYIDNIDFRLRTITDLNLAINQAMTDAGIEIAFPQRDVHLDTRRPLEVRIHPGESEAKP